MAQSDNDILFPPRVYVSGLPLLLSGFNGWYQKHEYHCPQPSQDSRQDSRPETLVEYQRVDKIYLGMLVIRPTSLRYNDKTGKWELIITDFLGGTVDASSGFLGHWPKIHVGSSWTPLCCWRNHATLIKLTVLLLVFYRLWTLYSSQK